MAVSVVAVFVGFGCQDAGVDELGINGPQVVIGTVNQTPLLANGQLNPAFITTQSGFPPTLANPASFNPINAKYLAPLLGWNRAG